MWDGDYTRQPPIFLYKKYNPYTFTKIIELYVYQTNKNIFICE